MARLSYRRHRFPPPIIQHAIWLYLRFTLSYRDVEELLAERGVDVSYETVRRWVLKFGPVVARRLRERRPRPSFRWHLDEMVVRIARKRMYLWRAVDHEGEILDILVQRRRDKRAALRLMRKLLRKQRFAPRLVVTDKLRSYGAAFHDLHLTCRHEQGLRMNNRAENSHQIGPSYHPTAGRQYSGKRSFVPDYYSAKYAAEPANLIVGHHVLEHFTQPCEFIDTVRQAVGDRKDLVGADRGAQRSGSRSASLLVHDR